MGRGTPAGELLRRYWHPVAVAQELTDEQPTLFVRLLGEDLILFKDKSGRAGLLADHCSHRGASLLYGRVEERGEDPLCVMRDQDHPVIDTVGENNLNQTGGKTGRGRPYGITTGTLKNQPLKGTGVGSGR